MLEDTTPEKQAEGSSIAHWTTHPTNDAGVVLTGNKTTGEECSIVEEEKDTAVGNRRVKSSIATTVSSESKHTGNSSNVHTSSHVLEEATDPTSSPSEMLDEPDRKCTESPMDSDKAVYGSNSVHSDSSESSTELNNSKRTMTAAVDLDKVEAMGGQFDESCNGREAASFHSPANDVEARYIIDKVKKANTTLEDIDLRPEVHFRDHGSSFQVSARPKEPSSPALDASNTAHKRNVLIAPDSLQGFDIEEGINIGKPRRRNSCCCIVM
ncbi:MAG: hypothetical protein Q9175_006038 [Cornicularia normoerica]